MMDIPRPGIPGTAKRSRRGAMLFFAGASLSALAAPGAFASSHAVQADSSMSLAVSTLEGKDAQNLPIQIGVFTELVVWIKNAGPPDTVEIRDYIVGLIDHLPGEKFQRRIFAGTGMDSVHIHIEPSIEHNQECFSMTELTIMAIKPYAPAPNGTSLYLRFPCASTTEALAAGRPSGGRGTRVGGPLSSRLPEFSQTPGGPGYHADGRRARIRIP